MTLAENVQDGGDAAYITMAAAVLQDDMVILSARSPRAQYVKRLLVEPPGAHPQRMRPVAVSVSNPATLASV